MTLIISLERVVDVDVREKKGLGWYKMVTHIEFVFEHVCLRAYMLAGQGLMTSY